MTPAIALVAALVAQTPNADALIEEGVTLREQGRDAEALDKFEAAYRSTKSSRALAQVALAEQALGRWLKAEAHLRRALKDRADPWIQRHRTALMRGLKTIRARLASVEVLASVDGAEIRINGRRVGRHPLGRPIRAVAGTVVVEVSADGYWPLTRKLELAPRARARERFELIPKPVAAAPATPPPAVNAAPTAADAPAVTAEDRGLALAPYAWVAGGAAVAAASTGVAFIFIRNGHVDDFNSDACLANNRTRAENCGDDRDAADQAELISIATFSAAGALAITSAILFLLDDDADPPTAADANGLAGCGPGPGDLGLGCVVRF